MSDSDYGMMLLPSVSFTVAIPDPAPVVAQRLAEKVAWWGRWWFTRATYWGAVRETSFKVVPITYYRNSGMPVLCGRFESSPSGTIIHVTMRLQLSMLVFACAFCSLLAWPLVVVLPLVLSGEAAWGVAAFLLFLIPFGYALTLGGFWFEVPRRREEITRILSGR
jgi:hypothetical protein